MANERTPLITTVRLAPPRRYAKRNVVARFCSIALSSTLLWFFLAFVVSVLVFPNDHARRHHGEDDDWSWPGSRRRNVTYDQLRKILLDTPSSLKAEDWSKYYTSGPHLTGKNLSQVGIHGFIRKGNTTDAVTGPVDQGQVGRVWRQVGNRHVPGIHQLSG